MKGLVDDITKYLWRIPKMDLLTVHGILEVMKNETLAADMLRALKENESILEKTTPNEAIKIALCVIDANK